VEEVRIRNKEIISSTKGLTRDRQTAQVSICQQKRVLRWYCIALEKTNTKKKQQKLPIEQN